MRWGRLINVALDCGLQGEDAVWAVLCAAERLSRVEPLLTGRETHVLTVVAATGSYAAAAASLGLAKSTVHAYVKSAAAKLAVTPSEAAAEAARRGLLTPEQEAA